MDRNRESEETLLFLHIPKAAGTTLARIAERQFPASRQYRLGGNAQAAIQHFNAWPESKRARYRYIAGHFPYGVHEKVPGNAAYLTFLRDPIERTASFYRFVRKQENHPITQSMSPAQRNSLMGFLEECQEPIFDNGQTRQLAGDWGHIPFGKCDEALFQQALSNLNQIDVVGLTEQFIPSLLLAAKRFNWRNLGYHSLNQTPKTSHEREDSEVRGTLTRFNEYDLRLYEAAEERFHRDCGLYGDGIWDEIYAFSDNHPVPSRLKEAIHRLKSRTPREIFDKIRGN